MNGNLTEWYSQLSEQLHYQGFQAETFYEYALFPLKGFVKKSKNPNAKCVYLTSGVHGDEPAGPLAIEKLIAENFFYENIHWIISPLLNPDGFNQEKRENAQGIDLNRDYFHLRSDEVKNHKQWLENQTVPDLMLSLHEDWESTGYYFYEINTKEDQPNQIHTLKNALNQVMPCEPELIIDDHEVREAGWIYHAAVPDEFECWPEAIFMANRGCPISLTMETPSTLELEQRINTHICFVKTAVEIWGK